MALKSSPLLSSKLLKLLNTSSTLRCHVTTTSQETSIITKAVQLIQSSTSQQLQLTNHSLNNLLFPNTSSRIFLQITRHLPSTSEALKFLHYLKHNAALALDENSIISSVFQVVIEIAAKECDSRSHLYNLYKMSKEWNVPLADNSAALLVHSFGQCGLIKEAVSLFGDVKRKNVHICNAMIGLFLQNRRVKDVLKVLDEMLQMPSEPDLRPNNGTRDMVFGYVLSRGKDNDICNLVLRFGERGVFLNSAQLITLISRLCRSGKTSVALDVLCGLMKLGGSVDTASWNALLTGLGRERDFERMKELLIKMKESGIQPDVFTFGILINHLCKFRRVDEALELFEGMSKVEENEVAIKPGIIIYNMLIDGLCKVGRREQGLAWIERMQMRKDCAPDTITYNSLIDASCKAGETQRALELFEGMKKEGVLPDVITFRCLITAFCNAGKIKRAHVLFEEMKKYGVLSDVMTVNTLLHGMCRFGKIDSAVHFFGRMQAKGLKGDAASYSILINGFCSRMELDKAHDLLKKMEEVGINPNIISYNTLIKGFCKREKFDKVYEIFKEMEKVGINPDAVTYNTLIHGLCKRMKHDEAYKILKNMMEVGLMPDVVTYNTLIDGFCRSMKLDKVCEIFEVMVGAGVSPDIITYNTLINGFCMDMKLEMAYEILNEMQEAGVKPDHISYTILIDGFSKAGNFRNALKLIGKTIKCIPPTHINYGALNACMTMR